MNVRHVLTVAEELSDVLHEQPTENTAGANASPHLDHCLDGVFFPAQRLSPD